MGQSQAKIVHLAQYKIFFKKFYHSPFSLLILPYHAKKKKFKEMLRCKYEVFLENFTPATFIYWLSSTILQSLKRILRADPGM